MAPVQRIRRYGCKIFCKLSKNEREIKKKIYYNTIIYIKNLQHTTFSPTHISTCKD